MAAFVLEAKTAPAFVLESVVENSNTLLEKPF